MDYFCDSDEGSPCLFPQQSHSSSLCPNLAGLAEPKDGVKVGQTASVYIKSIIPDKMKVKLIIIDSFSTGYAPEIKYFYDGDRLAEWDYSPKDCQKRIFSKFCS